MGSVSIWSHYTRLAHFIVVSNSLIFRSPNTQQATNQFEMFSDVYLTDTESQWTIVHQPQFTQMETAELPFKWIEMSFTLFTLQILNVRSNRRPHNDCSSREKEFWLFYIFFLANNSFDDGNSGSKQTHFVTQRDTTLTMTTTTTTTTLSNTLQHTTFSSISIESKSCWTEFTAKQCCTKSDSNTIQLDAYIHRPTEPTDCACIVKPCAIPA